MLQFQELFITGFDPLPVKFKASIDQEAIYAELEERSSVTFAVPWSRDEYGNVVYHMSIEEFVSAVQVMKSRSHARKKKGLGNSVSIKHHFLDGVAVAATISYTEETKNVLPH